MSNEADILAPALEKALADWEKWKKGKALLFHYPPDEEVLGPLSEAIEKTDLFKAIAGQPIFSGYSGVVIHGPAIAAPLLSRADPQWRLGIEGAINWFREVLTTNMAPGTYAVAIWGLAPDKAAEIADGCIIYPFESAPESQIKRRVNDLTRQSWDGAVWHSTRFYGKAGAIMTRTVSDFPYRGRPDLSFQLLHELDGKTKNLLALLQATLTGDPIVGASWFCYDNEELDFNSHENHLSWCVPEVEPVVLRHVDVPADTLGRASAALAKLPEKLAQKLKRSADRFVLSQCRHKHVDKILDLVIAFEILTSSEGERAPPGLKVSIRSAQLIGGALAHRQHIRDILGQLCNLRNAATHGGSLKDADIAKQDAIYAESAGFYRALVDSLMAIGAEPDWSYYDLEPRTRD